MASASEKKVTLRTADEQTFEIDDVVALQSETLKQMMEEENDSADPFFPLPNVSAKILTRVIEYCTKHIPVTFNEDDEEAKAAHEKKLKEFDDEFLKIDEQDVLFEVTLAANYLNIKGLLDLMCQNIADTIKEMSVEEVRAFFNIENDFTPEEEAEIRKKYEWAFEKDDKDEENKDDEAEKAEDSEDA